MKKVIMCYILPFLAVLGIVGLDQWVKQWTVANLSVGERIPLIEGVFEYTFVKNEGMAWGLFQNMQWLFVVVTPIVLGIMLYFYIVVPKEKRYIPALAAEIMLFGGAIGNLLDRMFRGEQFSQGYVVDMFYVKLIDFPVFNVADCFISISFIMLVILVLFIYKEDDFDKMFPWKKGKAVKKEGESDEVLSSGDTEAVSGNTDSTENGETSAMEE